MKRAGRPKLLLIDLKRSWGRLVSAGLGVALAAAVLTFLLGLGRGIENAIVGDLTPSDRIEVAAKSSHLNLGPLRMGLGSDVLDQKDIERIRDIPGVAAVWPKVGLGVPAVASGGAGILGQDLVTELAVEGIDPEILISELGEDSPFVARPVPGSEAETCWNDQDCETGQYCLDTTDRRGVCRSPIPVVVSEKLISLYNDSIRRAYGLPQMNPEAALGLGADVQFGASSFSTSSRGGSVRDRLRLVAFSKKVTVLGVTLPLEEVQRLNRYFGDGNRKGGFDSVTVNLVSGRDVGTVTSAVKKLGFRVIEDDLEKIAAAVSVGTLVMGLTGIAVVSVAILGVMHTFSLLIEGRRREIGVLRSIGASGFDVSLLFLSEAVIVGGWGGLVGVFAGISLGRIADAVFLGALPPLALLPESVFDFSPSLVLAVVFLAVFGAVGGAALPVLRAIRIRPVEML